MANKIQVRRGTKAQLTSYGALSVAELGYTTDTKELYIGNISGGNTLIGIADPWSNSTRALRSYGRTSIGTGHSLAANAFTKLAFNTVHQDNLLEFNTSLNRYVVQATGWYHIGAGIGVTATGRINIKLSIFVNNIREMDIAGTISDGVDGGCDVFGSGTIFMSAGDYVEIKAYPTATGTTQSGAAGTHFTLTKLA